MAPDWPAVAMWTLTLGRRSAEPKQVLIHVVTDMEEVYMDAVAVSVVVPAPLRCARQMAPLQRRLTSFPRPRRERVRGGLPSPRDQPARGHGIPARWGQEPAATMSRGRSGTMTKATTGITRKSTAE
uniref:Uncharacterized protein n=1 Tax=Oryza rufipogon TaxID=4529 RepID=A0A0E0QVR8_ORYRU